MELKLSFNMDNEVFGKEPELQIVWVLGNVAGALVTRIRKTGFSALSDVIKDSKGNAIGSVEIE